jgi:hypothetical protein
MGTRKVRGSMSESMSLIDYGSYWRMHAKEVRAMAEGAIDPEAKRELLEIAEKYELLAKRADADADADLAAREDGGRS